MFHTKDHKTGYLFDQGPFGWLGPRRKRLIDTSWAKLFREKILPSLPVNTLMQHYHLSQGAPTKELYTMLGVMVLQQMFDLTDEETVSQYAFNIQWHYALDITGESDAVAYLSPKTLWNMRKLFCENDLYKDIFDSSVAILATAFAVDTSRQRIDSVHIFSNMRHLGRIGLFVATIKKFLVNLTRHHRVIFDSLEKERTDRYLSKKDASVFSMVKPSESAHTLETLGKDLFFFIERFKGNTGVTLHEQLYAARKAVTGTMCGGWFNKAYQGCPLRFPPIPMPPMMAIRERDTGHRLWRPIRPTKTASL